MSGTSHLYWVTCTVCCTRFDQLSQAQAKQFSISSCGCMLCGDCIANLKDDCPGCKKSSVKVLPISMSLPPHLKELFNRNEDSLAKVRKRSAYQNHQFTRTTKKMKSMIRDLQTKISAENKKLEEKNEILLSVQARIKEKETQIERLTGTMQTVELNKSTDGRRSESRASGQISETAERMSDSGRGSVGHGSDSGAHQYQRQRVGHRAENVRGGSAPGYQDPQRSNHQPIPRGQTTQYERNNDPRDGRTLDHGLPDKEGNRRRLEQEITGPLRDPYRSENLGGRFETRRINNKVQQDRFIEVQHQRDLLQDHRMYDKYGTHQIDNTTRQNLSDRNELRYPNTYPESSLGVQHLQLTGANPRDEYRSLDYRGPVSGAHQNQVLGIQRNQMERFNLNPVRGIHEISSGMHNVPIAGVRANQTGGIRDHQTGLIRERLEHPPAYPRDVNYNRPRTVPESFEGSRYRGNQGTEYLGAGPVRPIQPSLRNPDVPELYRGAGHATDVSRLREAPGALLRTEIPGRYPRVDDIDPRLKHIPNNQFHLVITSPTRPDHWDGR